MKKPAKTIVPVTWATIGGKGAAQPGNRPGRGKSAHVKKKAAPKKAAPKVASGWFRPFVQAAANNAAAAKKAKKAKHHPKRQLALGEGVACCSAEALAASLRLAGRAVSDEDVLALYWRTASDADAGASILATLEAVAAFTLAGAKPVFRAVHLPDQVLLPFGQRFGRIPEVDLGEVDHNLGDGLLHALILGVDRPGPHAVLATPDGWWSWGELYDPAAFPDAVIEEAWAVEWEA